MCTTRGCGLPLAYVRAAYIAGVTDLFTGVNLASDPSEGFAARESRGEVNVRELIARRTSIDLEGFMIIVWAVVCS